MVCAGMPRLSVLAQQGRPCCGGSRGVLKVTGEGLGLVFAPSQAPREDVSSVPIEWSVVVKGGSAGSMVMSALLAVLHEWMHGRAVKMACVHADVPQWLPATDTWSALRGWTKARRKTSRQSVCRIQASLAPCVLCTICSSARRAASLWCPPRLAWTLTRHGIRHFPWQNGKTRRAVPTGFETARNAGAMHWDAPASRLVPSQQVL